MFKTDIILLMRLGFHFLKALVGLSVALSRALRVINPALLAGYD
jgi:hypothetical protein